MTNSSLIRNQPSHRLYTLTLELVGDVANPTSVILRATRTPEAKKLGVRFDKSKGDNVFDLSAKLGNINGQYSWGGIQFQKSAKKFSIHHLPCGARLLYADLAMMGHDIHQKGYEGINHNVSFKLDHHIGLVDYIHPLTNETYFKLGSKLPAVKEVGFVARCTTMSLHFTQRSIILCFDGTSNHFSNRVSQVYLKYAARADLNDDSRPSFVHIFNYHRFNILNSVLLVI